MYYAKNWCDDHCGAGSYDAWFRRQVEAGLKEAEEGKLIPFSHTVAKLKAMRFNKNNNGRNGKRTVHAFVHGVSAPPAKRV